MSYGELMPRLSPCPDELIREITAKYLHSPDSMIDIGCGRGDRLALLAKIYPKAYLAGIDADPDMVKLASGKGDVRLDEAARLEFESGTFDMAFCECSLSLFTEPENSLSEAHRVLKKGGVLLLGELTASLSGENFIKAPDGDAVKRIYSAPAIEKMAEAAGFEKLEFLDRSGDLAAMAAQMIFDGSFCACVGTETARLLMKLKAGYGLWVFGKE